MYDLIISNRKLNIAKIIVLVILVILLVCVSTILGMKTAEGIKNKKYLDELEEQKNVADEKTKEQNKLKEQQEKEDRLSKVNADLTEDEKYNILHIYNSLDGKKRVFLTFDDGPTKAVTPFILDILKQNNVKATFFVVGKNVEYNPTLLQREFDEGHYIANHGYSHEYSQIYSSPEATLDEYSKCEQSIRTALNNQYYKCKVFRFPGGSKGGKYNNQKQESKEFLLQNGVAYLDWNSLSEDSAGKYDKEQLLQNTIDTIGSHDSVVILMHDSSDKILTYEMLPDLINYLKQQGFTFENIYDLL